MNSLFNENPGIAAGQMFAGALMATLINFDRATKFLAR
jgi:hypothetical protein